MVAIGVFAIPALRWRMTIAVLEKGRKTMTDKEKAKKYDALMTAIDYTRKSINARMEEEKMDAEAQDCLAPLKAVLIGRLAVEQELLDLLERWKGQEG